MDINYFFNHLGFKYVIAVKMASRQSEETRKQLVMLLKKFCILSVPEKVQISLLSILGQNVTPIETNRISSPSSL